MTAAATYAEDTVSDFGADGRAILLLCGHFGVRPGIAKPLTPAEYHALADWLERHSLTPASLLHGDGARRLDAYEHEQTGPARLARLLDREAELDAALGRWMDQGIWVISERDDNYPWRLRRRIKSGGFPLLFGAGPTTWLNDGGLCVVGSRDCTDAARRFARRLGERCARESIPVISSDMRGIDRETVTATLHAGGKALNVLSDSLEKAVTARRNRLPLAAGHLSMVTPFGPSSRFTVSNAMRANKYQYSLSDAAVVVESRQTGGSGSVPTRTGAKDGCPDSCESMTTPRRATVPCSISVSRQSPRRTWRTSGTFGSSSPGNRRPSRLPGTSRTCTAYSSMVC